MKIEDMSDLPHQPMDDRPERVFQYCRCGAVRGKRWDPIEQAWKWEPWHVCKGCWTGMKCREFQKTGYKPGAEIYINDTIKYWEGQVITHNGRKWLVRVKEIREGKE